MKLSRNSQIIILISTVLALWMLVSWWDIELTKIIPHEFAWWNIFHIIFG